MQKSALEGSRPRAALAAAAAVTSIAAFALTPLCHALSFGGERVTSSLGQPLRMTIPLLGATGDSLDAQCFRVVTPSRSDGLTVITQARVELQVSSSPPLLIIRGSRSLDDPIVRVAIEAGCDTPIRREYTVLLDPPPMRSEPAAPAVPALPGVAPAATPPLSAPVTPPPAAADANATAQASVAPPGARGDRPRAQRVAPRAGTDGGTGTRSRGGVNASARAATGNASQAAAERRAPEPARDELRLQNAAGGPTIEDASLAALAVPRLRISSDLAVVDPGATPPPVVGGDELQSAIAKDRRARLFATPIEEDLAPRLEADLVVTKRRLAELQAQLNAAGLVNGNAATAAAPAANATKPAAKEAEAASFNWREWLWVPGALLILGLLWFLLRQRRKQQAATFAAADPVTVVSAASGDDEFDTVLPSRTLTRSDPPTLQGQLPSDPAVAAAETKAAIDSARAQVPTPFAAAEREASDRLNNPLFQLSDTAPHLDVSELSHITDEAQVYADLGRNDQAIELLRAHIDEQVETDRSSPAPWLMIFDLYRRTNNRAGYDELAPRFRKNFNGRMPDWDNYGHELALDDGIEAFPHLVARIERDWGTPAARKFLDELLYDNRGGSRLGFSLAAYRDILLLMQVHDAMAPPTAATMQSGDWESRGADDNDGTPKWDLELDMIEPPKPGELDAFLNRPPADKS